MKSSTLVILICCIFALLQPVFSELKLLMVQELFRHGARYPIYPQAEDYTTFAIDEKSVGQLTTQGKKMHYLLGKALYKQYWVKLFGNGTEAKTYNQSKFYIKSTDINRTIESAQSHLMGLFQSLPTPLNLSREDIPFSSPQWKPQITSEAGYVFPQAINYHPTAIHVEKGDTNIQTKGDFLRTYSTDYCPNQNVWMEQNMNSQLSNNIVSHPKMVQTINAVKEQISKKIGFFQVYKNIDNYVCSKYMRKATHPIFQDKNYAKTFGYIQTLEMLIKFFYTKKQLRATATGFFNATVNNIKNAIEKSNDAQWIMYSAHDTTVLNMLAAMNMTNADCVYQAFLNNASDSQTCIVNYPLFTSNIIFQLYRESQKAGFDDQYIIKVRYDGQYRQIPICKYKMACTYNEFSNWYNNFKDENFLKTCGVSNSQISTLYSFVSIQAGIIVVLGIYLLVGYLKKGQNQQLRVGKKPQVKQSLLSEQGQHQIET